MASAVVQQCPVWPFRVSDGPIERADDLARLFVSHRPVVVLALSADEFSVFRMAATAGLTSPLLNFV